MLRRMRWLWFAAALLAGLAGPAWVAADKAYAASFNGPRASISVSYFYDALAPYGRWVNYSPYGWCWSPSDVSFGWRPYSDGDWDYTDYGWTWVDNEPWGWAPYHFGRWLYDDAYGWMWVPGTDWAPAWVAWSADDNWVGWTPLPPGVDWNASFGVSFASFDVRRVPSNNWCFVARRDLATPDLRARILPVGRNVSIFAHTQNVTQFAVRGGRPVNMGPNVASVEHAWGHPVPRMRIVDAAAPRNVSVRPSGGQLQLFRGQIAPAAAHAAPPVSARRPLQLRPAVRRRRRPRSCASAPMRSGSSTATCSASALA